MSASHDDDAPPGLPETLPVLPLRDTVTYPDTLTPLAVGQDRSIQLVNDVLTGDRMLVMLGSLDPDIETPGPDKLHTVGVAGVVARMLKVPDGSLRILVQAGQRVKIDEWVGEEPYLVAKVTELPDEVEEGPELTALMRNVQQTFTHIIEEVPYLPEELQMAVANLEDPSALAHLIAGALRIKVEEKQALLEEVDVGKRLRRLSEVLARELDIVAIGSKIQSQVMSEMESSQREYVLRQQLKAIQEELGEKDPAEAELDDLRSQLAELGLPEDVRKQADRELSRLEKLPQAAAEHGVIRTYLEWIASLPWDRRTDDNLDLAHARAPRRVQPQPAAAPAVEWWRRHLGLRADRPRHQGARSARRRAGLLCPRHPLDPAQPGRVHGLDPRPAQGDPDVQRGHRLPRSSTSSTRATPRRSSSDTRDAIAAALEGQRQLLHDRSARVERDGRREHGDGRLPADPSYNLNPQAFEQERRLAVDSLRVLAEQTGGFAAVERNDYADAFDRIVRENSSYYVLGYYPPSNKRDGKFHKIEVKLKRPGLRVIARKGYAAPKGKGEVTAVDRPPAPRRRSRTC